VVRASSPSSSNYVPDAWSTCADQGAVLAPFGVMEEPELAAGRLEPRRKWRREWLALAAIALGVVSVAIIRSGAVDRTPPGGNHANASDATGVPVIAAASCGVRSGSPSSAVSLPARC
jgi:hypothetical protein